MCMRRDDELEAVIISKYAVVAPVLNERARPLWAATESQMHELKLCPDRFRGEWNYQLQTWT